MTNERIKMTKEILKCVANTSKSLDFVVGSTYEAVDRKDSMFEVISEKGWCLIMPLDGYFVKFIKVTK